jgi:hypothetical protein
MRTAITYTLGVLASAAALSIPAGSPAGAAALPAPAGVPIGATALPGVEALSGTGGGVSTGVAALWGSGVAALPAPVALAERPVRTGRSGPAQIARALNITDTAHLHFVRETASSILIDEGKAAGGLPGVVKVGFEVGATVRASFTLSSRNGALIGSGVAKPHSTGGEYSSFAGTLTITHGTARYAHAHGQGGFYGTIDRGNDAVTVQTTGTLAY